MADAEIAKPAPALALAEIGEACQLAPVAAPTGQPRSRNRPIGQPWSCGHPPRCASPPVEGQRRATSHPSKPRRHGRGLDQRLQVRPGRAARRGAHGRPAMATAACCANRHQHRFVPVCDSADLLREEEAALGRVPVSHRRASAGSGSGEQPRRAGVVRQVRQPPRRREAAQMLRSAGARRATRPTSRSSGVRPEVTKSSGLSGTVGAPMAP